MGRVHGQEGNTSAVLRQHKYKSQLSPAPGRWRMIMLVTAGSASIQIQVATGSDAVGALPLATRSVCLRLCFTGRLTLRLGVTASGSDSMPDSETDSASDTSSRRTRRLRLGLTGTRRAPQSLDRSTVLTRMHAQHVGRDGRGRHGGEGTVETGVGFESCVPAHVDNEIAALRSAEVAVGAMEGLLPGVGPLVDPNLPQYVFVSTSSPPDCDNGFKFGTSSS